MTEMLLLVSRGLARSFGEDAARPGKSASALRSTYDRLEAKAWRERPGAWGDGAAEPTMELGAGETEEKEEEKPATDTSDIMGNALESMGIQ